MGASSSMTRTTRAGAMAGPGCASARSGGRLLIVDRHGRRHPLDRQREPEAGAPLRTILRPDPAPMRLDEAATDGQAQPDALAPVEAAAVELLEDALGLPGRKPGATIGDLDRRLTVL